MFVYVIKKSKYVNILVSYLKTMKNLTKQFFFLYINGDEIPSEFTFYSCTI